MGRNEDVWNIQGLLIGNGWIGAEQYKAYLPFAYKEGIIEAGTDKARRVESQHLTCLSELDKPGGTERTNIHECEQVLQEILEYSVESDQCINMYDIRLRDSFPSCGMNWPPDLAHMSPYLRRSDVARALHLNPDKRTGWVECSGAVSGNFHARKSKAAVQLLPGLLEAGVPIVLFSGAKDLICNHVGTEDLIHNMKWLGGTGFELSPGVWAPRHAWTFDGEPAGIYQEARNLTYVLFYNSSHMVPFDYPRRTRDMLDRFIGVDISHIGGVPADSRIDGTKVPPTSVDAHPNSTTAKAEEEEKLKQATWRAYYRSGEAALVVVIIMASVWGFFVWRDRRRRQASGYRGIYPTDGGDSSGSLARIRNNHAANWDVEAGDFDESELDTLHRKNSAAPDSEGGERAQYAVGEESSDEEDERDESKTNLLRKPQGRTANRAAGGAGESGVEKLYGGGKPASSSGAP